MHLYDGHIVFYFVSCFNVFLLLCGFCSYFLPSSGQTISVKTVFLVIFIISNVQSFVLVIVNLAEMSLVPRAWYNVKRIEIWTLNFEFESGCVSFVKV